MLTCQLEKNTGCGKIHPLRFVAVFSAII